MSSNRFSCLKPNDSKDNSNKYQPPGSRNNFRSRQQTNNRWKRDSSPEKKQQNSRFASMRTEERNSFSKPPRDNYNNKPKFDRNKPKFDKGGFGRFRYNRGRRGPSIFDNVEKDNLGRPMLAGATTSGFNIAAALQKSKNKKTKKDKKKVLQKKDECKNCNCCKKNENLVLFKKEEKTEEQLKAEADWNKQMILNMQYEWETDSDQEGEEGEEELEDE